MIAQFADDLAYIIPDMWRQHLETLGCSSPRATAAAERVTRLSPSKTPARTAAAAANRQSQHQQQQQLALSKQQQAADQLWEQGAELRAWRNQLQGCLEVIKAAGKEQGALVGQLEEQEQQRAALEQQNKDVRRGMCNQLGHELCLQSVDVSRMHAAQTVAQS